FRFLIFFFFSSRRRHTRSKRDWSSDVCSSDLTRNLICRLSFLFSPINPTSYCSFFNRTSKHLNVFLLSTFYHAFSVVASSIFGTQITLVFAVAKMPPSPHLH